MSRRLLLTSLLSLLFIPFLATPAMGQGLDCPALSLRDGVREFEGMEVYLEQQASTGVRLVWKNPIDYSPTSHHIYRKKAGEEFRAIGITNGLNTTYLDSTIDGEVPAYLYAIKSEFYCGGILWSRAITIETPSFVDTTPPVAELATHTEDNEFFGRRTWLRVRDTESYINPRKVTLVRYNDEGLTQESSIRLGRNYGNGKEMYFEVPTTTLPKEGTAYPRTATLSNIESEPRLTPYPYEVISSRSTATISSPAPGSAISAKEEVELTINGRISESEEVKVYCSVDNGESWKLVTTGSVVGNKMTIPAIEDHVSTSTTSVLLKIELEDRSVDMIPVFLGDVTFQFVHRIPFIHEASGTMELYDAVTGRTHTFPTGTPGLKENSRSELVIEEGVVETVVPPGLYYIKLVKSRDTLLAREHDIAPPATIIHLPTRTRNFLVPVVSSSYFIAEREPLSNNQMDIINNKSEPVLLTNLSKRSNAFERVSSASKEEQSFLAFYTTYFKEQDMDGLRDMKVVLAKCISNQVCANYTYEVPAGEPLELLYNASERTFDSDYLEDTVLFTASDSVNPGVVIVVVDDFISFTIDDFTYHNTVTDDDLPLTILKTDEGEGSGTYRFHMPITYLNAAFNKGTFLTFGTGQEVGSGRSCWDIKLTLHWNGERKSLPINCTEEGLGSALLFPQRVFELEIDMLDKDPGIITEGVWWLQPMTQFQRLGLLHDESLVGEPHEPITRAELIALTSKSMNYPSGHYKSNAFTFGDLPSDHQFLGEMLGFISYGILSGDDDPSGASVTTFRPDDPVKRVEALKLISFSLGTLCNCAQRTDITHPFTDLEEDQWYMPFIKEANAFGIIQGYETAQGIEFRPENTITRAEAITLIQKYQRIKAVQGIR